MTDANDLDYLPTFRGQEFRPEQLDALLAFAYSKNDLEDARPLFASKWWDYRYVHLGYSLFLFAHHYGQAAERWRSKFGINAYAKLDHLYHPVWRRRGKEVSLAPDAARTGWLRATMTADAFGIPYDRWVNWAFEYAFECQWQRLPSPTMLYGDRLVAHIRQKWQEDCDGLIALPTDPRFLAANYCGHAWQDEFQKWLMDQIAKRQNPITPLRNFLITEPFISEHKARERFGPAVVHVALNR